MADDLTPEQRRRNMQAIRSKDTTIELRLRKALWERGVRYRKNYKKLIGKPDIAITKYKIAVFCDSDYWHGYDWENRNQRIKSNRDYWVPKIERNMERDREVTVALQNEGWLVLRFWEWQIRKHLDEFYPTTDPQLFYRSVRLVQEYKITKVLPGHHQLDIPTSLIGEIEDGFAQIERNGQLKQGNGLFEFRDFQIQI